MKFASLRNRRGDASVERPQVVDEDDARRASDGQGQNQTGPGDGNSPAPPREAADADTRAAYDFGVDEAWPTRVDGSILLTQLAFLIRRFMELPITGAADAIALWIVHSYTVMAFAISPLLCIMSPEKRCGKTTLITLLHALVRRPLACGNVTPAALYRVIDKIHPTLLLDEADTYLAQNDDLRCIVNGGYARIGAKVLRCHPKTYEPVEFDAFGAKAIAQIGDFPETIMDRGIVIGLSRKRVNANVEELRQDRIHAECEPLRRQIVRWSADNIEAAASREPVLPPGLHDRARDNWRPLLALAETAGGEWPERARRAACELSAIDVENDSTSVQLLSDIKAIFRDTQADYLSTEQLLANLTSIEERPWNEFSKGKPLTATKMAGILRPHKIRPHKTRVGDVITRGFERQAFVESWERYVPD